MGGVFERGGDVGGVLAVRLGNLRQGLAWQLRSQLGGGNANRGGRSVQVAAEPTSARSTWTVAEPKPTPGGKSGVSARLTHGGLQRGGANAQPLGQRINERLVMRRWLPPGSSGGRRARCRRRPGR